jgi:hypothetical protein
MRAFELISEETLQPVSLSRPGNSNYYRNLINLIRSGDEIQVTVDKTTTSPKIVKTVVFSPKAADILERIWNPTGRDKLESPTPDQLALIKTIGLPTEDGDSYRVNQIEKTGAIKQKVGETPGEKTYSKWWNDGNVAEAIMATAVLTKFQSEGAPIEAKDVFHTAQTIKGFNLEGESFGKKLELKISLAGEDYKAFLMSANDPQEFLKYTDSKQIYKLFSDCATYVNNSSSVKAALEKIKKASSKDVIQVTADGATHEAQHSTKADLWIALNGKKEKLLSIKTSTVKHIGGHAGFEFDKLNTFFNSVVGFELPNKVKAQFQMVPQQFSPKNPPPGWKKGDPIPTGYLSKKDRDPVAVEARQYNWEHGIHDAYEYVGNELTKRLASKKGEYDFVKTVASGVVHHATLGEDVRVVVISPSAKEAYKELAFGPEFYKALENYDLTHEIELGKNYRLLIYGHPKTQLGERINSGDNLFVQLRTYNQDKTTRNVVEMGGLLKKLTDITEQEGADTTSQFDTRAKPVFAQQTATTAPSTAVKQTTTTTNTAVQQTATPAPNPTAAVPVAGQDVDQEEPVSETGNEWTVAQPHHIDELERMLHLVKHH